MVELGPPEPPRGASAAPPPMAAAGCHGVVIPICWASVFAGELMVSESICWIGFMRVKAGSAFAGPPPPVAVPAESSTREPITMGLKSLAAANF